MSNTNQQPQITDMIRLACQNHYAAGETTFSFDAQQMAFHTVKRYAEQAGMDIDDEQVDAEAARWVGQNTENIAKRFKPSFAQPIIKRFFAHVGKAVVVSVGRNDANEPMITVTITDEEVVKPKRKSRAKKKQSIGDILDSFVVDVSKLGDSELMVRDVNEIVRQMKAHILSGE